MSAAGFPLATTDTRHRLSQDRHHGTSSDRPGPAPRHQLRPARTGTTGTDRAQAPAGPAAGPAAAVSASAATRPAPALTGQRRHQGTQQGGSNHSTDQAQASARASGGSVGTSSGTARPAPAPARPFPGRWLFPGGMDGERLDARPGTAQLRPGQRLHHWHQGTQQDGGTTAPTRRRHRPRPAAAVSATGPARAVSAQALPGRHQRQPCQVAGLPQSMALYLGHGWLAPGHRPEPAPRAHGTDQA